MKTLESLAQTVEDVKAEVVKDQGHVKVTK